MQRRLMALSLLVALAGCTAVAVRPVNSTQHAIAHVCIQQNEKVIVAGFVEAVEQGLTRHGITSERYQGDKPPGPVMDQILTNFRKN